MSLDTEYTADYFDRQQRIEWWDQRKLSDGKVLVIGAGALGNEVIKNLSLIGLGHLFVVDFDIIEDSNLSRAVLFRNEDAVSGSSKARVASQRGQDLNPYKQSTYHCLHGDVVWDLGLGVYRHCDVVIGCLDNIEARLSVNLNSWKTNKTWIDGGMWELAGSVGVYGSENEKACYECGMTKDHYRLAKTRYSCTNSVVRAKIRQGFEPTTQTTSAIIGAIQTQEAIKKLHDLPSFFGRRLMFNGAPHFYLEENNPTYIIDLSVNPGCLCHAENRLGEVHELCDASSEMELGNLFSLLHQEFGDNKISLDLSSIFLVNFTCPYCGNVTEINQPKHRVRNVDIVCPTCEVICPTCGASNIGTPDCFNCGQEDIYEPRLETVHRISEGSDGFNVFKEYSLEQLGIPLLQILKVNLGRREYFIELTADLAKVWQ